MNGHASSILLPTDPAERRRLWREWIEHDVPGERMRVRRAEPKPTTADQEWLADAIPHPPAVLAGLRSAIAEAIYDGQIAMSDRRRLTTRAMQLGLSRFEASLLIAAVLHRDPRTDAKPTRSRYVRRLRWTTTRLLAMAIVIEAIAAAGAVAYFR